MKPVKPIILIFDDGYEDNYFHLMPLLKKHHVKAVIFVLADEPLYNNRWNMAEGEPEAALMSPEQIIECHQSGCVEIASHGISHRRLTKLTDDELAFEISATKRRLEEMTGDEVVSFAYPTVTARSVSQKPSPPQATVSALLRSQVQSGWQIT